MRRFFVLPEDIQKPTLEITDDEFHHLKNVCRLTEGERIELLDGQGFIAIAEIINIGKKSAQVKVLEKKQLEPPQKPSIKVYLCVSKFQTMDLIVQKLVELGVTELICVLSERSFLKKESKELDQKIIRWNKIAQEACKQSGRVWPLKLKEFMTLESAIKHADPKSSIFLYEGKAAVNIKEALSKINHAEEVSVFVGSEGGFSPNEVELFQQHGLKSVTVGDLVLRVETACIAVCSIIKYQFDLMKV
jgi:16S rRNA (uracil1498-N3)-methyltransferase